MGEDKREQEMYERDLRHPDELDEATEKKETEPDVKRRAAEEYAQRTRQLRSEGKNPEQRTGRTTPGRGALNFFRAAAVVEAVVIAFGVGIIGGISIANQISPAALLAQAGKMAGKSDDTTGAGSEVVGRYAENLTGRLAEYGADEFLPFEASIEEVDGMETLCLTKDDLKIYYQNEYTYDEVDSDKRIRLENASRVLEFEWDYDLNGDLTRLTPEIGAFNASDTTQTQMVFQRYDSSAVIPEEMRFVDMERLVDYEPVYLKKELLAYFSVEKQVTVSLESVMKLTAGETVYRYYMPEEQIAEGITLEDNFKVELKDGTAKIACVVSVEEGGYLGELTAAITHTEQGFAVSNVRFGAYARGDAEDAGKETIITPEQGIVTEYITISGKGGERFFVPLSDKLQRMGYDKRRITEENGFKVYRENGVKISKTGIDVSKYQGDIDWQQVKDSGVEFAIIRLGFRGYGQGSLEIDPYYEQNMKGAGEVGMPVGVYFFSQAITVQEAKEEAELVLEWIKDYQVDYPIVFDTEAIMGVDARANELPRELRTDIAIAFCERIKEGGYRPMVYANTRWLIMNLNLERLSEYDLWYAYFGDNLTFPYYFDIWQYSDKGSVPGIEGAVDLNICFRDYTK